MPNALLAPSLLMEEMKTSTNSAICIMCNQDQESRLNQNKTQDQDPEQTARGRGRRARAAHPQVLCNRP